MKQSIFNASFYKGIPKGKSARGSPAHFRRNNIITMITITFKF